MMLRRSLLLLLWLLAGASAGAAGHEVTFHLVPEGAWNGGEPRADTFLPEGWVLLFRHGAYEPALTLEANTPGEIPPGDWHWIAEAPGYVSVLDGALRLPARGGASRRTIVWPVVPACEIDLGEPRAWQGVARLDAVSLERGATYPAVPRQRRRFPIPAGRFLAYTVGARGVMAIARPANCRPGEVRALPRPSPPPPEEQDLIVTARLPEGYSPAVGDLQALAEPAAPRSAQPPSLPAATVGAGQHKVFFFLGASAAEPLRLALRHPELLTATVNLSPLGGGVREIHPSLHPRLSLEITVDYQPKREHERQELVLFYCGERPNRQIVAPLPSDCRRAGDPQPLSPGLASYRFAALDAGWYLPEARIDDERVRQLGNWYAPFLSPDSPPVTTSPPLLLREFHIHGHLLLAGEPVAGEARLEPALWGSGPVRRFPTDADLLYHIYYFGESSNHLIARFVLPEEWRERPEEELRGLFYGYRLSACTGEGFCRPFHKYSSFSGDGRWDLDLGASREVEVRVVDSDSGEPVAGARVYAGRPHTRHDTVHFLGGETRWRRDATLEDISLYSDAQGLVRRRDLPAGEQRLVVVADGYETYKQPFTLRDGERLRLSAALERESEESEGNALVLRFPDRSPVARAFLLMLRPDGTPDYPCLTSSRASGEVRFPPGCLDKSGVEAVVLHPQARLGSFPAAAFRAAELEVEPLAGPPLRLRLLDAAGQPRPDTTVALRLPGFTLLPDHCLLAYSFTGWLPPFRTDGEGLLPLPGIDAADPLPAVALTPEGPWLSLPPAAPDGVTELLVP